MSGPKVFYVVTREELIARCEAQLRLLDAAIAEWRRTHELNGAGSAREIDGVATRRSALLGLLSAERFAELQKQVAAEISFLRGDAQHRLERAVAAAAEARQARRRTGRTVRMLLEALERSGRTSAAGCSLVVNRRRRQSPPPSGCSQQTLLTAVLQNGSASLRPSLGVMRSVGR